MPTAEEQVFSKGASLTPTLGAPATVVEQAIELALPTSYRGLVIYSDTTPATSGEPSGYPTGWYEWHKRCLWLKPSTGEVFQWNGTTWALAVAKPGANTITAAMIANGTITIDKLLPTTGMAGQVIRSNLAENAMEAVDPPDLFGNNEIAISKLAGSSVGSYLLTRNGPTKSWTTFDSATIVALFGSNEIPVDYLAHGAALQVPMMNSGGTAITWSSVISGIADYTVPLTKISKTIADAGKYLRVQADGSVQAETLTIPTPAGVTYASSSEVAAGIEAAKAVAPATVGSISGLVKAKFTASVTVDTVGFSAATLTEGINIASLSLVSNRLRITFTTALASANYAVVVLFDNYQAEVRNISNRGTAAVDIAGYHASGATTTINVIIL